MDIIDFNEKSLDETLIPNINTGTNSNIYQKNESNLQYKLPLNLIKTVCTTQISYVRIRSKEILIDLFSKNLRKFITRDKIEEIFNDTKVTDSDQVIYSKFRNVIKVIQQANSSSSNIHISPPKKWTPRRGRESRESSRQQDIFKFYNGKSKKYLDLGGGDGKITTTIGKHLKLSKQNIICADIDSWLDNKHLEESSESITYVKLNDSKNSTERLPFGDGEFSLITCFQSLHHIKNNIILSELYRILEPGGYIIIREHDCDSNFMKILIDIEHCIFETILKDQSENFISTYYGEYRSGYEWTTLFENNGLYYCKRRYNFKTTRNNPTRYYYAMYFKE